MTLMGPSQSSTVANGPTRWNARSGFGGVEDRRARPDTAPPRGGEHADGQAGERSDHRHQQLRARRAGLAPHVGDAAEDEQRDAGDRDAVRAPDQRVRQLVGEDRQHEQHRRDRRHAPVEQRRPFGVPEREQAAAQVHRRSAKRRSASSSRGAPRPRRSAPPGSHASPRSSASESGDGLPGNPAGSWAADRLSRAAAHEARRPS